MLTRFPTATDVLKAYNKDRQADFCKDIDRCYQGTAPRIGEIAEVYGSFVAESWLAMQLQNLAEFSSVKKPEDSIEIYDELAKILLQNYPRFKVTEFMVFFQEFKSGLYGEFYGVFDPLVVTRSLRQFERNRKAYFARIEREQEQKRRKQEWEERERNKATPEEIDEIMKKYGWES